MHVTKMKRIAGCLAVCFLTVSMLAALTRLMERKDSRQKYEDFFAQDKDFDVLFFGASDVVNGIFPMELWKDYGIVSYNMAGHSNELATSYWVMENALDYTTPKLAVIDCLRINRNVKSSDIFSFMHISFDAFPLSTTKIKAVWDILDDPMMNEREESGSVREEQEKRTRLGLLWNYSVYHSRWNELTENDFSPEPLYEKGAESRVAVSPAKLYRIDDNDKITGGALGEEYLRKIIEDCKNRGIEVLLIYMPFPADEECQMEANYAYDLAKEYDVNYINFLDEDVVDFNTDLYDDKYHLNPSGARKITDYLGSYISANYPVEDRREDTDYSFWNVDYREYCGYKNSLIEEEDNIYNYLMLLAGDGLDVTMDIKREDIINDNKIKNLLSNLGIDEEMVKNGNRIVIGRDGDIKVSSIKEQDKVTSEALDIEVKRNGEIVDKVKFTCYYDNDINKLAGKKIKR